MLEPAPAEAGRILCERAFSFSLGPVVVYDLDVVAFGVEDVGCVVAGVVARALRRLAVAAVARFGGGGVKAPYALVIVGGKGYVQVLGRGPGDERERAGAAGEADPLCVGVTNAQSRVRRDRLVEPARGGKVGHADPEMVDDAVPA